MMKRSMKRVEAEHMVAEAYRLALGREPDAGGLETYVTALLTRDFDALSLLKELLGSEEGASIRRNATAFAERQSRTSVEAEHIVSDAYATVLGRMPDDEGKAHYVDAVRTGQLDKYDFLRGLLSSPEYTARIAGDGTVHHVAPQPGIPEEIVLLLQEMIAARFLDQGCRWALPPISASGQVVPAAQVIGLIRTLVMLCETRAAAQQAH